MYKNNTYGERGVEYIVLFLIKSYQKNNESAIVFIRLRHARAPNEYQMTQSATITTQCLLTETNTSGVMKYYDILLKSTHKNEHVCVYMYVYKSTRAWGKICKLINH